MKVERSSGVFWRRSFFCKEVSSTSGGSSSSATPVKSTGILVESSVEPVELVSIEVGKGTEIVGCGLLLMVFLEKGTIKIRINKTIRAKEMAKYILIFGLFINKFRI